MKLLNKSIYALSLVGMMGLWSCSQEEMVQGGGNSAKGHAVPVTLTVSRDAQTRTVLSENEFGGLNDVWVTGDVLHVYNKAGEEIGTLNLQEGEDTSVGVFSGLVNAEEGQQELNLWYYTDIESNPNLSAAKYSGRNGLKVDLHTQNFADAEALSALDILSKGVTLNVNGEKSTVVKDETLEAHLAMARFSLKGLPQGAKGKLNIYNVAGYGSNVNTGEEYYNTLNTTTLDFARLGKAQKSTNKNDIVVENVEAGKDVYVAFVPSAGYQLGFVFTNAADGKKYSYAFENKTELEAGNYYCSFNQEEGVSNVSGVEIALKEATAPVLHLNANFAGAENAEITIENESGTYDLTLAYLTYKDKDTEQNLSYRNDGYTFVGWSKESSSETVVENVTLTEDATYYAVWAKNPLYKWAEGDLVYNKSTKTNSVATSYTTQASLYQWGRNIGWSDYRDALGTPSSSYIYPYGTYGKSYATATGLHNGYDDSCMKYTSASNLPANKDKYFMDPDGTDYWVSSFGDGGSNWDERAVKCGWSDGIAPVGYRMATKADFLEIKPSNPISGSGTLASLLGISEMKSYKGNDNFKIALHWSSKKEGSKHYLKIDAKVVSKDFKETDLSKIDWSDKASVMTRCFGAHGFIHGFKHTNIVSQYTFPVARPMPGTEVHVDYLWQTTTDWTVLWNYIKDLSANNEGYYWMFDEKSTFTFQDNAAAKAQRSLNTSGVANGSYVFSSRQSVFGTLPTNAQDCAAIRCIITDRE